MCIWCVFPTTANFSSPRRGTRRRFARGRGSTGRGGASPCCTRERRRFDRSTSPLTARRWPSRGRTRGDDSSSPPGTSVSRARRRGGDGDARTQRRLPRAVRSLFALRRRRPLRVRQKFRPRVSPSKGKTQGPERPPRRPRPAKGEGERGGGRDAERRRLVGVLRSGIHDVGVCALDPRRVQTEEDVRGNHHGRGGADRLPRETPRVRVPAARRGGERTVRVGRNRRVGVGRRIRARLARGLFRFFSRGGTRVRGDLRVSLRRRRARPRHHSRGIARRPRRRHAQVRDALAIARGRRRRRRLRRGRAEFATASSDGTARVWSADTGEQLYEFDAPGERATTCAFRPRPGTTERGDAKASNVSTADAGGVASRPQVAARHLAVGYAGGYVRVFDVDGAHLVAEHRRGTGAVTSVTFTPCGRKMLVGNADGTLCVHDAGRRPVSRR